MSKVAYIVTGMDCIPLHDVKDDPREFKTERQALKAAQETLAASCGEDSEVWVWRLSHVLSKPSMEAVIDKVRA